MSENYVLIDYPRPLAVDTAGAAAMLGVSRGTLENWRYMSPVRGPRFSRLGGKIVYPVSELQRYLEANIVRPDEDSVLEANAV